MDNGCVKKALQRVVPYQKRLLWDNCKCLFPEGNHQQMETNPNTSKYNITILNWFVSTLTCCWCSTLLLYIILGTTIPSDEHCFLFNMFHVFQPCTLCWGLGIIINIRDAMVYVAILHSGNVSTCFFLNTNGYHIFIPGWWFGRWILWLSIYWECHNPNWLSYFSEG